MSKYTVVHVPVDGPPNLAVFEYREDAERAFRRVQLNKDALSAHLYSGFMPIISRVYSEEVHPKGAVEFITY